MTGVSMPSIRASANAFIITSGPTPLMSPIVIPIRGRSCGLEVGDIRSLFVTRYSKNINLFLVDCHVRQRTERFIQEAMTKETDGPSEEIIGSAFSARRQHRAKDRSFAPHQSACYRPGGWRRHRCSYTPPA